MRRGVSGERTFLVVIFFAVFMLVATIIYGQVLTLGKQAFTKEQCRASLLLTSTADRAAQAGCIWKVQAVGNPVDLKCNRKFMTITPQDVEQDGKSMGLLYDDECPEVEPYSEGDACLAENVLAKEMVECWDTFFKGEVAVFQQLEEELNGFLSDNKHRTGCFVCAEVAMQDTRVRDLRAYLNSMGYENGTYHDYLVNRRGAFCSPNLLEATVTDTCWDALGNDIENKWPAAPHGSLEEGMYAVTFVRYGMESTCQRDGLGDMPSMSVQVLPSENIGEHCDLVLI